jgi:holliday junction DNA helicase RuvA
MIGFLSGKLISISDKYIIIDVHGVGYRVTIGEKIRKSIAKIGSEVKMFTHFTLSPRDGQVELYGFESAEELSFFGLLTTVSGVGPKSAQAILSNVDIQTLQMAIMQGDDSYLKKVSGVGEKTAKRLILELKNKMAGVDMGVAQNADFSAQEDAVDALVTLGYTAYHAREAIKQVSDTAKTSEEKIKEALRVLGNRK